MRSSLLLSFIALVSVVAGCRPMALGDVKLDVFLENGTAKVFGHIERLDDCRRAGALSYTVNDVLADPPVYTVGLPEMPCAAGFAVELPYDDDGLTETLRVSTFFTSDLGDEVAEVSVLDGLPHRFVDLALDNADDVLTRGSRHHFEVRPGLAREHEALVVLQRPNPMPPVVGTWVTPSSLEYAVSPSVAAGSGLLEVELTEVGGPRDCTIDDGPACTITTTTRASRDVQIVVP